MHGRYRQPVPPVQVPAKQRGHGTRAAQALPDPWGVSQEAWESIEANLFATSLFPYLAFLWLLDRPEVECPPRVSFAFKFLLVFVFATIPAGIYAKAHYGQILANVDWLHGTAESLLTVTNLLLALALRDAISKAGPGSMDKDLGSVKGALFGLVLGLGLLGGSSTPLAADALPGAVEQMSLAATPFALHAEPGNALSIPTWAVHTSSVIEYLVAMGLVWNYAEVSGNPRWKGLTWGMLPLHSSGITACVYHLFYNAPTLNALVALQASLTCIGNATCAFAAYRIWRWSIDNPKGAGVNAGVQAESNPEKQAAAPGWEDLGEVYKSDSNLLFALKLGGWALVTAPLIKYGELALDMPFAEKPLLPALAIIAAPSLLNVVKWASLSRNAARPAE